MKENPIQLEFLKSVLLSQLLLECNENLRYTKQYNGALKHLLNKVILHLETTVYDEYRKIYEADAEMTTNILNSIEDVIIKLTTSDLDELVMINAVIEKYKENKDWFVQYGSAEFLRIDG
jgi:prephenate dehydrogenase